MRPVSWRYLLIVALLPCTVHAQQRDQPATINLEVLDQSGAYIPGARAFILPVPKAAGEFRMTDRVGKLSLSLAPGHYSLTVQDPGFKTYKQELEAKAGVQQTISITLIVGSCTQCLAVTSIPIFEFPSQMLVRSPDGRYLLHREEKSGRHFVGIEDLDRKTWRTLMEYHQRLIISWMGSRILATDYFDSHTSRCYLYSLDKKTPPISVWDVLDSQLQEDEKQGLENALRSKQVMMGGYQDKWGGIDVWVTAFSATGQFEFRWDYHVMLPRDSKELAIAGVGTHARGY